MEPRDFLRLIKNSRCVVAIKGDWGTGKTYFWNNFKDENLSDKPYTYVSPGKDSIADIKRDVILKYL